MEKEIDLGRNKKQAIAETFGMNAKEHYANHLGNFTPGWLAILLQNKLSNRNSLSG